MYKYKKKTSYYIVTKWIKDWIKICFKIKRSFWWNNPSKLTNPCFLSYLMFVYFCSKKIEDQKFLQISYFRIIFQFFFKICLHKRLRLLNLLRLLKWSVIKNYKSFFPIFLKFNALVTLVPFYLLYFNLKHCRSRLMWSFRTITKVITLTEW